MENVASLRPQRPWMQNQGLASALLASVLWPGPQHLTFWVSLGASPGVLIGWDQPPGFAGPGCTIAETNGAGSPQEAAALEDTPFE